MPILSEKPIKMWGLFYQNSPQTYVVYNNNKIIIIYIKKGLLIIDKKLLKIKVRSPSVGQGGNCRYYFYYYYYSFNFAHLGHLFVIIRYYSFNFKHLPKIIKATQNLSKSKLNFDKFLSKIPCIQFPNKLMFNHRMRNGNKNLNSSKKVTKWNH